MIDLSRACTKTIDLETFLPSTFGTLANWYGYSLGSPRALLAFLGDSWGGELLKNIFKKKVGFQIFFQGHQKLMHLLLISLYKIIDFIKEISGNAPRKK